MTATRYTRSIAAKHGFWVFCKPGKYNLTHRFITILTVYRTGLGGQFDKLLFEPNTTRVKRHSTIYIVDVDTQYDPSAMY